MHQLLYGLPVAINKIADLSSLKEEMNAHGGDVVLMIDHPAQILAVQQFEIAKGTQRKWPIFIKIDGGQKYISLSDLPSQSILLTKSFLGERASSRPFPVSRRCSK